MLCLWLPLRDVTVRFILRWYPVVYTVESLSLFYLPFYILISIYYIMMRP